MTLPQDVIGVDIAKGWIDVFHASSSRHERIAVTKQSLALFAPAARGCLVVLEASGGYERPLTGVLAGQGVGQARVNPCQPVSTRVNPRQPASGARIRPRHRAVGQNRQG